MAKENKHCEECIFFRDSGLKNSFFCAYINKLIILFRKNNSCENFLHFYFASEKIKKDKLKNV